MLLDNGEWKAMDTLQDAHIFRSLGFDLLEHVHFDEVEPPIPDDVVERDDKGFVLTGAEAGADGLLETSVAGIYAAGDVRSGSIKRCATAVGEGAMVVRFVHERLSGVPA